ncbi:ABC transporter permease [Acidimicrobiia bacterium EGI L10123]|uniref:ABC transporter permease n=1 Tax=Salinilacustrithrix flava TaxID=2957203 RepID=UPI003D7C1E8F|nr:ABC transporter permease [Acidimicrobiia bacterium EGI L10123]
MLVRRLLTMIPLLFFVTLGTFMLTHLIPGDPAITVLGDNSTPERVEAVRERLGLNEPLLSQYADWISGVPSLDLGTSLFSSEPVRDTLANRIPVTLSLTAAALFVAVLIGVPAGILAATNPGRWIDRVATIGATLGVAAPSYLIGSLLIAWLALKSSIFPATGYVPMEESVVDWARSITLPAVALGSAAAAEIARQLRGALRSVLQEDYVRTARAMGLRGRIVVGKYALKNAMIPLVTVIGFQVTSLLGGTVIIEQIFGIQGLGSLAVRKVLEQDIPVVQGIVLVSVFVVIAVNLVVDLMYSYLDPKVRVR